MKHLKQYKMFESQQDVETVLQNIRDIFQEFTDQGLEITAMKNKEISKMMRFSGWLLGAGEFPEIFTGIKSRRPQPYSYFADSIHHLVSYMKDCGYEICGFSIFHLYHGSYVTSGIWKDKKPYNFHIKPDPLTYCEEQFSNIPVKDVEISFSKIKD